MEREVQEQNSMNNTACDMKVEESSFSDHDWTEEIPPHIVALKSESCDQPAEEQKMNQVSAGLFEGDDAIFLDRILDLEGYFHSSSLSLTQNSEAGSSGKVQVSEPFRPRQPFKDLDENLFRAQFNIRSESQEQPLAADQTTSAETSKRGNLNLQHSDGPPVKKHRVGNNDNVVEAHLKQNCIGQAILNIEKTQYLDQATRTKLAHEVVVGELGPNGNKQITGNRFNELARGIVEIFPKELEQTYFIPWQPAKGFQSAVQPKGILYDKYHNLLKFLRKTGLRGSIRQENAVEDVDDPTPNVNRDIEWLEKYSSDAQAVASAKWQSTAQYRILSLRNSVDCLAKSKTGAESLDLYIQKFACLSQSWGPTLLLQDFEFLYGGKYISLIKNWPSIYLRLLKLAKKTEADVGPSATVKCLKRIPALFNQPIIIAGSKQTRETWKPNSLDSSQGFLLHVKTLSGLEAEIERLKEKCQSVKKTVQPFPAVIGPSESDIHDSYVVIDNLRFHMESPLVALDTCFKMYHALHCHYPFQSSYSWLFLQQAVYGFKSEWDFNAPSVTTRVRAFDDITV